MKVASSDLIRDFERELINKVKSAVDINEIRKILKERHNLEVPEENIEFQDGRIIVVDNERAYNLEFNIMVTIPIILDSEGNYIPPEQASPMTPEEKIEEMGDQAGEIAFGM